MHFTEAWDLVKDRLRAPRHYDYERHKVLEAVAILDVVLFELGLITEDMDKLLRRLNVPERRQAEP